MRRDVLIVTPHLEPTVNELARLLRRHRSVDVYCSAAPEVQGSRTSGQTVRFYWLDPLQTFFRLALRVRHYRLVVNYYHRNGYWLGLWASLRVRRRGPALAWIGFAPNPHGEGIRGRIKEMLTYRALLGHDLIVCNTRPLIATVARRFPKVARKLAYARWGGTGDEDVEMAADNGYIFAGGRTNRDFETLLDALSGIQYPAIVVAPGDARLRPDIPDHVAIYRDLPTEEFQRLLLGASIVAVALKHAEVSSGQVVLNRAMRSGKAVVITATAGIDEYVEDGHDAILVAPGDVRDLRAKLSHLIDDPQRRQELGHAARRTYETTFNSRVFARALYEQLQALSTATSPSAQGGPV
jgi:glycosyltransferase involved in cell wall biosynthesis